MARRAVSILALLATLAGCSDEAAPRAAVTTASTTPVIELPDGIEVAVEYPRYLQVDREALEVVVDNRSRTDLEISAMALRSPLFEPLEAAPKSSTVRGGRRVDIQVGLGPSVCPAPPGPSRVEITAEVDGARFSGLVAVDAAPLESISATDCGRERVRQHVDVTFGNELEVEGGTVHTAIALERLQGDDTVQLAAVRGSVLIELTAGDAAQPLGTLGPDEHLASVPVRLRVVRCDPHAVIESKKTFQLSAWVGLGDAEPQHLVIVPHGELRAALETLIQECLRTQTSD